MESRHTPPLKRRIKRIIYSSSCFSSLNSAGHVQMTKKTKQSHTQSALEVVQPSDKSQEQLLADLALDPSVSAAATVQMFGRGHGR